MVSELRQVETRHEYVKFPKLTGIKEHEEATRQPNGSYRTSFLIRYVREEEVPNNLSTL